MESTLGRALLAIGKCLTKAPAIAYRPKYDSFPIHLEATWFSKKFMFSIYYHYFGILLFREILMLILNVHTLNYIRMKLIEIEHFFANSFL